MKYVLDAEGREGFRRELQHSGRVYKSGSLWPAAVSPYSLLAALYDNLLPHRVETFH